MTSSSSAVPRFSPFLRVVRVVSMVVMALYTLAAVGILIYTGWPPLRARFGVWDLTGFFFCILAAAILGGLFTDVMPSNVPAWLLLVVAAAGIGLANYEAFYHRYGGWPGWALVAVVSLSELIGMCAPAPVFVRLLGASPATVGP